MDKLKKLTSDHPWSSLSTITTFDLGDENDISENTTINNKNKDDVAKQLIRSIQIIGLLNKKTSTPISLLVQSLVQQLCSLLESDPIKSAKLYNVICEKLYEMKLIDESYSMEEFEVMRSQYQRALYQLVGVAKDSFQPPVPQNRHGSDWSRYYREFMEIEFLGGGGFGRVFKAKHRLDGSEYAVKKICIRSGTVKSVMSHLDEVKTFASLNHPNIVQYKAAWLEPLITKPNHTALNEYSSKSSTSFSQSKLITHSSDFNYYAKSTSLSIEFADSSKQTISKKSISTSSVDKQICCINEDEDVVDSIDCSQGISEWATLYIQMALCQLTLRKWIDMRNQTEKEYPPNSPIQVETRILTIKEILRQLAQGLEYMHSKGIVHHDIKPTNIFISTEIGHISVQLGDFGLACPLQKAHSEVAFGTHLYAAPEQLKGKCDTKNDIYSLGIVLLELIESFTTDMEKIQNISELRKGRLSARISAEYPQLAHIMSQLVAKNPSDRPSATQLLSMLTSKPLDMYDVESMQQQIVEKDAEIERLRALLQNAGISES